MPPTMPPAVPAPPPKSAPNAAAPSSKALNDPLLQKVKESILSVLPPDGQKAVESVVLAGMKILYSPSTRKTVANIYNQIAQGGFQPKQIANGVNYLMALIMNATNGNAPLPALYPAGVILLCYVLDDLEKLKGLQVNGQLVTQTEQFLRQAFMQSKVRTAQSPTAPTGAAPAPAPGAAAPGGLLAARG